VVTQLGPAFPPARGADRGHLPERPDPRRPDELPAGRAGDPPSVSLAARLRELKLPQGRLKTGTPPRIDGRSIDFSVLTEQPGDDPVPVFSFLGDAAQHPRQVPCWITTPTRTHEIIRGGLDRSPMYTGRHRGRGSALLPVDRGQDPSLRRQGQPPDLPRAGRPDTHEIYPNGISTSLPFDVQLALVRSIRGLENAHILRPGYAIEYDYFDPRGLKPRWKPRSIGGLFFAGQINGTTGYEEAAAQGLLAGLNAALLARSEGAVVAAPRRGLPGCAGRRPDHPRRVRALPHVHQPRRIPPQPARGQCRPAPDRAGRRLGLVDDSAGTSCCAARM
jgi:tRNA uridine 5-carboxymethylaminomethyl modification enzyme